MACVSPSPACPVCLDNLVDARLLPCLHSVCKTCVHKMLVTATDGNVKCPICRATVTLPSGGVESLPKDVTVLPTCQNGERRECALCEDKANEATTWCKKCHLAFCDGHAGRHITSASTKGEVHNVIPLADLESSNEAGHAEDVFPRCLQHNEPLKFHCGSCDVSICGDCAVIGDHHCHKPVRYIKDIVEERKREVAEKVDRLESEFTRKLERSLQAVDHMSTEVAKRADEVRTDIRQAGKRAVEMVEAHVEQMVQGCGRFGRISLESPRSAEGRASGFPGLGQQRSSLQRTNHAAGHRKGDSFPPSSILGDTHYKPAFLGRFRRATATLPDQAFDGR